MCNKQKESEVGTKIKGLKKSSLRENHNKNRQSRRDPTHLKLRWDTG